MANRNRDSDERPIQRVGPVLCGVREHADARGGNAAVQAQTQEGGKASGYGKDEAYNRCEEGFELKYAGKVSGRRSLSDDAVGHCRRAVKSKSIRDLAKEHGVSYFTMYNAVKGLTYKHLNHRFPPAN